MTSLAQVYINFTDLTNLIDILAEDFQTIPSTINWGFHKFLHSIKVLYYWHPKSFVASDAPKLLKDYPTASMTG